MGKKSTDEQVRPEDPEGNAETSMMTLDQDQQLERYKHLLLPLLHALMRGRTTPESMLEGTEEIDAHKLLQRMLEERHQWEEVHERDRQVKLVRNRKEILNIIIMLMQKCMQDAFKVHIGDSDLFLITKLFCNVYNKQKIKHCWANKESLLTRKITNKTQINLL